MLGCSTLPINSPHGLARDGDPNHSTSKKTRPPSRLTGRGAIASEARLRRPIPFQLYSCSCHRQRKALDHFRPKRPEALMRNCDCGGSRLRSSARTSVMSLGSTVIVRPSSTAGSPTPGCAARRRSWSTRACRFRAGRIWWSCRDGGTRRLPGACTVRRLGVGAWLAPYASWIDG